MSRETMDWLHNNILVGNGVVPWHGEFTNDDGESNVYPGFIPVGDVIRRLFHWSAIPMPVFVQAPATSESATGIDTNGNFVQMIPVPDKVAWGRSDNLHILGMHSDSYAGHQYREWLLDGPAKLVDDQIGIGSAGVLQDGAQAWVSIEPPASITTPEGVEFRGKILATTSFDGTIPSTFKRVVTLVVCDNTREAALREKGATFKVKHTRHSGLRIADAREALGIIFQANDEFAREVASLCQWEVSEQDWSNFLSELVPIDPDSKRSVTVGSDKRDAIDALYRFDSRCNVWKGTAFGVHQTLNTFQQWQRPTRGGTVRSERNMGDVLSGAMGNFDRTVLDTLAKVTNRDLAVALG